MTRGWDRAKEAREWTIFENARQALDPRSRKRLPNSEAAFRNPLTGSVRTQRKALIEQLRACTKAWVLPQRQGTISPTAWNRRHRTFETTRLATWAMTS